MIIKSMSRKTATFSQLVRYMDSKDEDSKYNIFHNLHAGTEAEITRDFVANSEHIKQRKNGVYMYHEILSISKPEGLDIEKQKEKLHEIGKEYAKTRSSDSMIYGVMHNDAKHHLHYHFLISANKVDESKKQRLSKSNFDKMKRDFESYVLASFPELEQKPIMTAEKQKDRDTPAKSNRGGEVERRVGKRKTKTAKTRGALCDILETVQTKEELFEKLSLANLEFYANGKTVGVKDRTTGYPYRLATLGLESEFYQLSERLEAKKQASESSPEPRTRPEQGVSMGQGEEATGGQSVKAWDKTKKNFKEWVFGDFKQRDMEAKAKKQLKEAEMRKKVKDEATEKEKKQAGAEQAKAEAKEEFRKSREKNKGINKDKNKGR